MKIISYLVSMLMSACATTATIKPVSMNQFQETAVMVMGEHGGGSGVIFRSTSKGSYILTNRHVCGVIAGGGFIVHGDQYPVIHYKTSVAHDICYIHIAEDLGINTKLALKAPAVNSKVFISGHPSLYPHIVSEGYVAGLDNFPVGVDERDCTEAEALKSPIECIIGGKSIVKMFEAQVVSALISPGSSGSGAFNSKGELIGLAFAGQGELGYALVVPWEFLNRFVKAEAATLAWEVPDASKKLVMKRNRGLLDLNNWEKILKLIEDKNQCLKSQPYF